jgi:hypothetical protein
MPGSPLKIIRVDVKAVYFFWTSGVFIVDDQIDVVPSVMRRRTGRKSRARGRQRREGFVVPLLGRTLLVLIWGSLLLVSRRPLGFDPSSGRITPHETELLCYKFDPMRLEMEMPSSSPFVWICSPQIGVTPRPLVFLDTNYSMAWNTSRGMTLNSHRTYLRLWR